MRKQDKAAGLRETEDKNKKKHTKFDPEMALEVIDRLASGDLLVDITSPKATPVLVSRLTFMEWVATVPELQEAYNIAIQLSAAAFEEFALKEGKQRADEPGSPQKVTASKNLMQQYQWSAERRDPGKFGQKNNVALIVPVHISTPLDLGQDKRSVSEDPEFYKLRITAEEGEFSEVSEQKVETETEASTDVQEQKALTRPDFRALLRADEPVIGMDRQPLLAKELLPHKSSKRQLFPRVEGMKGGAELAQEKKEKQNGIHASTDAVSGPGTGPDGKWYPNGRARLSAARAAEQSNGLGIVEVGPEGRVNIRPLVTAERRAKPFGKPSTS